MTQIDPARSFTLVLLPGLHGTAQLFPRLIQFIPDHFRVLPIAFPNDQQLTYAQLLERLEDQIESEQNIVLIAESFSGPIAIEYAAAHSEKVKAVVMAASFAAPPRSTWIGRLMKPFWFRLPAPTFLIRFFITGWSADPSLATELKAEYQKVDPTVLALRMQEIFREDCLAALHRVSAPILYLLAAHDRIVPATALQQILAHKPDVVVRSIDSSHLLLAAAPQACWVEIERFLNALPLS